MKKFYAVLIAFAALFLADISFARLVIEPGIPPVTVTSGTFYNAVETSSGAWFCNKGELIISTQTGNTIFLNNITDFDGGAIYAFDGSTTTIGSGVEFSSNTARFGGAVWNGGKMTIENKVVFSSNTADAGGAIGNFGELTVGNEVEFSSNTAKFGGAIGAMPGSTIMIGTGVTFSSNTADAGGAIYTHQEGSVTETVTIMISSNAVFISNKSGAGGAIYANPDSEITIGSDSYIIVERYGMKGE